MSLSGKKRLVAELQFLTKTRSEDLTSLLGSIKATVNSKECKKEKDKTAFENFGCTIVFHGIR